MPGPVLFREVQRFHSWWIAVLCLLPAAVAAWAFVQQIILGIPFGNNPAPDWVVIWVLPATAMMLPLLIFSVTLETEIRPGEIRYRMRPFHGKSRRVAKEAVAAAWVRRYRPLAEYGGWGLRYGGKAIGWACNISGDMGIQLVSPEGKRLLLGTQRPEEAAAALRLAGFPAGGEGEAAAGRSR